MRLTVFLTLVALVPAYAQLGTMKPPAPFPGAAKPGGAAAAPDKSLPAVPTLTTLEKEMDGRLSSTGAAANDPCYVLGLTRGLYLNGFGAVFTSEVDLVNSPNNPFQAAIGPEQKALIHKRKLAHVAMLQQSMHDMVLSLAASPALKMADADQIVVAVRLVYRPWEDTTGLPGQIVLRADRRGANLKTEIQ